MDNQIPGAPPPPPSSMPRMLVPPQQPFPLLTPRSLRRDIRTICLLVAVFIASITIASAIIMIVTVVTHLLIDESFTAVRAQGLGAVLDYVSDQDNLSGMMDSMSISTGIISCLSIMIGSLWFFILRGKRFVTTDITRRNESPTAFMIIALIALMFGIQFFMVLFNLALQPILNMVDVSATDALEQATSSLMMDPFGILYIVIVGPIVEELVFRGAVMRKLEPYGANFAIITSAILFGLYHIILYQAVFAFLIGLIFAYVAGRYSLKWAIAIHILNNLLAVVSQLTVTLTVIVLVLYLAGFIASIVLVILKRDVLVAQKRVGAPLFPRVFRIAYSSPFFILYIVVFVSLGLILIFP